MDLGILWKVVRQRKGLDLPKTLPEARDGIKEIVRFLAEREWISAEGIINESLSKPEYTTQCCVQRYWPVLTD